MLSRSMSVDSSIRASSSRKEEKPAGLNGLDGSRLRLHYTDFQRGNRQCNRLTNARLGLRRKKLEAYRQRLERGYNPYR